MFPKENKGMINLTDNIMQSKFEDIAGCVFDNKPTVSKPVQSSVKVVRMHVGLEEDKDYPSDRYERFDIQNKIAALLHRRSDFATRSGYLFAKEDTLNTLELKQYAANKAYNKEYSLYLNTRQEENQQRLQDAKATLQHEIAKRKEGHHPI